MTGIDERNAKGRVLEEIAALLHEFSNAKVEIRVKLPTLKNPKRKRGIDVLLSSEVAGYPVRIAIECKNYATRVGSGKIDAFIGVLEDVGIPACHGVFIAASVLSDN